MMHSFNMLLVFNELCHMRAVPAGTKPEGCKLAHRLDVSHFVVLLQQIM